MWRIGYLPSLMLFNIINLIIWLLYYVIYVLVHMMHWVTTFLYIIHINTHMLFSMTGAVSCRCGICISRSPPVPNEVRLHHPYIFICMFLSFYILLCSRTIAAHQLMLFVDWNRLKIKLIVLYCIVLYCIVLHCIALHCIALHCIALHCIALHCIALHCIVLYCIVLYCIVLYCIVSG